MKLNRELTSALASPLQGGRGRVDYFFTTAGKKAVAYLDFNEDGWFIPPAYESDHVFAFRSPETEQVEDFSVKIYPNPGSVIVNLEINNHLSEAQTDLNLTVYDSAGKLVFNGLIKSDETLVTLQTDSWSSGLYSYQITSKEKILSSDVFEIIK